MKKIFKKENAITLIAVTVTIIVLIILVGVTIGTLKNSNLFENAKIAKEKYKNSQKDENSIIDDYSNQIDLATTREETITINKSDFQNLLNKANNTDKMMKPNTWEVDVEQDFGNGLYGYRKKGTISNQNSTDIVNTYITTGVTGNIINCGGCWSVGGDIVDINYTATNTAIHCGVFHNSSGSLYFQSHMSGIRENSPYDIWILYTK